MVLTSPALTGEHRDLKSPTELNSQEYLKTYIEAFTEGERYFEAEFKASPEVLYGANQKQYIQDLHNNYFHIQHRPGKEGWSYVKHQYPFILTNEAVKTFGYYSGLVSKVDELVERHPQLFATFNECSRDEPKGNAESNRTDLRQKIEKHFAFFSGQCPRKHKTILSDDDFKKLIDWTVSYYSNGFQSPKFPSRYAPSTRIGHTCNWPFDTCSKSYILGLHSPLHCLISIERHSCLILQIAAKISYE